MSAWDQKKRRPKSWPFHILFWVLYILFNSTMYGANNGQFKTQLIFHCFYMPVVASATYLTAYVLIPHLLLKKRILLFVTFFLVTMLGHAYLMHLDIIYLVTLVLDLGHYQTLPFFSFTLYYRIVQIYSVVTLGVALKIIADWYDREHRLAQAQRDRLKAELKALRMQLHPHFLFNTLNNLYALTLKQSPMAPKTLLRLSELLDDMLTERENEFVTLKREIAFIHNYIALEQLRYGDELELTFAPPEEVNTIEIAPFLLLPLIENAFKHGRVGRNGKLNIHFQLWTEGNQLFFTAENSQSMITKSQSPDSGLGLENLRKRLDLLYPHRHTLTTSLEADRFIAQLHIEV